MTELTFKQRFFAAQGEIKNIDKDAKNPHYNSQYTQLPSVIEIYLPVLQANDLIYRTEVVNAGSELVTYIEDVHSEAEYHTTFPLLEKSNMQKLGSSLTYAQRYSLLSIMGKAAGIDDDGNEATIKSEEETKPILDKEGKRRCTKAEADSIIEAMKTSQNKEVVDWINRVKILDSVQLPSFWETRLVATLKDVKK